MATVMEYLTWLKTNYPQLLASLIALVFALETIVNLTPTKTGAGALARIGKFLDGLRDKAGLPAVVIDSKKDDAPKS